MPPFRCLGGHIGIPPARMEHSKETSGRRGVDISVTFNHKVDIHKDNLEGQRIIN